MVKKNRMNRKKKKRPKNMTMNRLNGAERFGKSPVLTKHKNQKQHTQTMYEEDGRGGDQGGT